MAIEKQQTSPVPSEQKEETIKVLEYSEFEKKYLGKMQQRIWYALVDRDRKHDEFDGMTYLQRCEDNRKGSNTYVEPKKNKEDTNYASGTGRQKLMTYLSSLSNLDLFPDISAFNQDETEVVELGESMQDLQTKAAEVDNDDEKKILRQYTMLEQGEVFVNESFEEQFTKEKNVTGVFDGTFDSIKWTTKLKKTKAQCTRTIIPNEQVVLGDIRVFNMESQPFVATVEIRSYPETKAIYGGYERFQYVPREVTDTLNINGSASSLLYSPFHFLQSTQKEDCEIVKYYDKWNNEYMVSINGIMLLPLSEEEGTGFPLTVVSPSGEYPIVKQVNEVINANFAYGKSVWSRMRNNVALYDEASRMAILKFQKSVVPPLANNTGKLLSSRVLMPGKVTMGVDPTRLQRLDPDGQGLTNAEFEMLRMMQDSVNRNSLDPVASGQQPSGGAVTATQILEVQRQAKMVMGLTIFSAAMLEQKLAWLRTYDILEHYFKPEGYMVGEGEGAEFINQYRSVSVVKKFEGVGIGRQVYRIVDDVPMDQEIQDEQDALTEKNGYPVRVKYLSAPQIRASKLLWYITVIPREKKTSASNKILFEQFAASVLPLGADPNYIGERFSEMYDEDPTKVFPNGVQMPEEEGMDKGSAGPAVPGAKPSNRPGMPNPRTMINSATNSTVNSASGSA